MLAEGHALLAVDVHELELKVGDALLRRALKHERHAVAVVLRLRRARRLSLLPPPTCLQRCCLPLNRQQQPYV